MKGYFALAVSIVSELCGTTMLKLSDGFTNIAPSIGVVICFGISFYFLSLCLKTVPLSLAYAIWSGIGTAFTAVIGVVVWNDPFNVTMFIGLVLIIGGVVLLNGSSDTEKVEEA